jgi:hypothetical protein
MKLSFKIEVNENRSPLHDGSEFKVFVLEDGERANMGVCRSLDIETAFEDLQYMINLALTDYVVIPKYVKEQSCNEAACEGLAPPSSND